MTLSEIAKRIDAHLQRIESNPDLNLESKYGKLFHNAQAWRAGRFCQISYKSYWSPQSISKELARAYLDWLDAGNSGSHQQFERERAA